MTALPFGRAQRRTRRRLRSHDTGLLWLLQAPRVSKWHRLILMGLAGLQRRYEVLK